MEEASDMSTRNPILHVLVIGFHHKKGCQVEYSYPPLLPGGEGGESECPPGWKYLPTLALPDGSHNFDEDTVYFHLPSLVDPNQTVFGISCFRQIPVEKIKNRTADITRGTVQKSVCVLSSIPLYGHIQVKMALITHAYFEEGDFTKVSLLKDTYHHLNGCLQQIQEVESAPQLFVGLSARDLILQFRHKALLLFKLLLLERRVVFYRSPVQPLCATILSLLSLHPGMIEKGLYHCACIRPSRPMSPVPQYEPDTTENKSKELINSSDTMKNLISNEEILESDKDSKGVNDFQKTENDSTLELCIPSNVSIVVSRDENLNGMDLCEHVVVCDKLAENYSDNSEQLSSDKQSHDISPNKNLINSNQKITESELFMNGDKTPDDKTLTDKTPSDISQSDPPNLPRDTSMDTIGEINLLNNLAAIAQFDAEACGCPLEVFSEGYLCLPYLSLPYMDVLLDPSVRGYFVGATNVLFKQKKKIAEIFVEVETGRIETGDLELRRLLHLSTEDLRFADFLVRQVAEERHDVFVDGVGWEGGDEWIRAQFRVYMLCLLRTSLLQEGSRELDHFNASFVSAWRLTHNYAAWEDGPGRATVLEINPGHPFAGHPGHPFADMKLRLSHTMQNSEGGRKINQAMASTGRAVATTGRAVGGAISQAKGAFSNWWSNLTTAQSPTEATEPGMEALPTIEQNPVIEV